MNYGFIIDNRKCIGCHACTVACKAEHDIPLGVNRTWVKYIEKGVFPDTRRFFTVLRCNHCADAPCVTICPVSALFTREDGIVDFDGERCIGCKACMQACPYDALHIDPASGTAAKCNFCAHRVEVGLEPPCAVVCPERAILAGDLDDPSTEIARTLQLEKVQVRKPEKGTEPKVFYIGGDAAALTPAATAVPSAYLWSQAREPGPAPRGPARDRAEPAEPPRGLLADDVWDRVRAVMGAKAGSARRVYDAGQSHEASWGWKVSAYLWTKSIAAGALMLAPWAAPWQPRGAPIGLPAILALIALLFLALTGALLVADLKRPDRFLWVLTRPQWDSWLTRGSYILLAFGLLGGALAWAELAGRSRLAAWLAWPALAAAIAAATYTAFLFWQSKGRDLWQSSLLPLHLLVQALVGGLSVALLCIALLGGGSAAAPVRSLIGLLLLNAALIGAELFAIHPTEDAAAAARWARRGWRRALLIGGVLVAGHALPLLLLASGGDLAYGMAALLALLGLAAYEHLYVRAGQSVALS
ncbi:MAG TPA: 4Fe-4S dicluster domain-containing protein [Acidobacteriota bacterium]